MAERRLLEMLRHDVPSQPSSDVRTNGRLARLAALVRKDMRSTEKAKASVQWLPQIVLAMIAKVHERLAP